MSTIAISEIVIDLDIYPRSEWTQSTVDRYAEALGAGETLPPIVLETDTNRLLDGMHRFQAHKKLGLAEIAVEHHTIPVGVPVKLYAASLSARHGDRISGKELQEVAREIAVEHPDFNIQTVAKYCGVTRQTVGRWIGDITERRRTVRKVKALLLDRLGWTQEQAGEYLGVDQTTIMRDVKDDILHNFSEDILQEALEDLPQQCAAIAEEIREERIFANWSDEERDLLKRLREGETIVVSMRDGIHDNIVKWTTEAGLYVRIDRKSEWGNPFEIDKDGDRDTVIRNYDEHYLPHKPSLLKQLGSLKGRALGCWCAPHFCHGDVLKARIEEDEPCMEKP